MDLLSGTIQVSWKWLREHQWVVFAEGDYSWHFSGWVGPPRVLDGILAFALELVLHVGMQQPSTLLQLAKDECGH